MTSLPLFKLENFFAHWEFKAPYLLCTSDMESWSVKELLNMADQECSHLWDNLTTAYTETKGLPILREEIAKQYAQLSSDNILCTAGAEEAIFATLQTLINPGDHIITFRPAYQSLIDLPKHCGAEVTALNLQEHNQWKIDLAMVKSACKTNTKMIIINFPHNPTGALLNKNELLELISIAREHNAYIFADEVYRLIELEEADRLPPLADLYEKGISASVLTKAYGLGGLRIGWIATQDHEALMNIANTKHYLSISNSAPSEILGLIALRSHEQVLGRNGALLRQNFKLLCELMTNYADLFSWHPPKGGCIAFPKIKQNLSSELFCQKLLERTGVLLMPSPMYNWGDSHFRIGFGRRNFPEVLAKLTCFIEEKHYV